MVPTLLVEEIGLWWDSSKDTNRWGDFFVQEKTWVPPGNFLGFLDAKLLQ